MNTPDWDLWRSANLIDLGVCVSLAMNLDPNSSRGRDESFYSRLDIASGWYQANQYKSVRGGLGTAPAYWRVSILEFAKLAEQHGWSLPEEFPRGTYISGEEKPKNSNLKLIAGLMKASGLDFNIPGISESIEKSLELQGIHLTSRTIRDILTEIKKADREGKIYN